MELRCDQTNKVVQPVLEKPPSDHHRPLRPAAEMMEVDMPVAPPRPAPLSEADHHHNHHHHHHHHPSPASAPAHAPAPASTAPSSTHQSPIPPPAPYQKQAYPPITRRPSPPPSSRSRDYSLPAAAPTTNGHHRPNGAHYPSPSQHDVAMDALHRLQTQVQYNTAGLETQRRDFDNLQHAVGSISDEMVRIEAMVLALRRDLQARPIAPVPPSTGANIDDATLEVFASTLSTVTNKVNEIDALKMQVEIVKRRIKIMEAAKAGAGTALPAAGVAPPPNAGPLASPREQAQQLQHPHPMHATHPNHQQHSAPPFHASPPGTRLGTPAHTEMRSDIRPAPQPTQQTYHHPAPQEMPHSIPTSVGQPGQQGQSGWVSVNPTAKRAHPNGVDSPPDGRSETTGSPKRPKLAPLEPRLGAETSIPIQYDRMDSDERDYQTGALREQQYPPSSTSSTFIAYNSINEQHAEENWRAELQQTPASAGKESRRGRGSGRGRGRRSMPADTRELDTPEWEAPGWNGSQVGPDGYYQMEITPNGTKVPKGSSLMRRSSGGGGGPIAMRPIEMTRPSTSGDPYAHTKKTRTKPIRNADGILIRKDGRPDMRSQSSAANLRKVHARKEQERVLEQRSNTPTAGLANAFTATGGSSTPDPDAPPPSTQDRHEAIMRQMFPRGIHDQATRNFHEKYFPPGSSSAGVTNIKPEVSTPSEREDVSESDDSAEKGFRAVNGRSPASEVHDGDRMDTLQAPMSSGPVAQAA